MQKILIVEDDKGISKSLKLYLENSGFEVFLHEEGLDALNKIEFIKPDLLILDINLPGKDGIEIAKQVRKIGNLPIVMLTARSSEIDRIIGLEIGADDYIAKPFSPRELLARINTILRRFINKNKNNNIYIYENIKLDLKKKIVELDNKPINLTSNEYNILEKIFIEDGKIVKRETLMIEVIGYDKYLYDRTIDTHIKNLRKKLGRNDIILTIRGEGYRLNK